MNEANLKDIMNEKVNPLYIDKELEKCKKSPYYFATTYLTMDGKPFTTIYTEQEFNDMFKIKSK